MSEKDTTSMLHFKEEEVLEEVECFSEGHSDPEAPPFLQVFVLSAAGLDPVAVAPTKESAWLSRRRENTQVRSSPARTMRRPMSGIIIIVVLYRYRIIPVAC